MKYSRPRGTHDVTPAEIERWRRVESAFERAFDGYGYRGIRTPIFEHTELFVRAVGEQSDIVSKEMYTFKDRGDRDLTLRPENTASVIRAYLENGMHRWGGIQRLWYTGPMFRYDRPQAGRYRQFHQVGAEVLGSASAAVDAEVIQIVVESLAALGFAGLDVRLNSVGTEQSRGPYRAVLLDAIRSHASELSPDALERYSKNPLRIFDSKEYGEKLKHSLPVISDHLVDDDAAHFARVRELLSAIGVKFTEDKHLVRGLDYYTRTVFEVYYGAAGAQSALCGGGRYDDLVRECGGPDTPAVGFSAGLERIVEAMPAAAASTGDIHYYVVCVGAGAEARALAAARTLRTVDSAELDLSGRSRKTQLESAAKKKARIAVVIDAATPGTIEWHDLRERTERRVQEDHLGVFAHDAHGEENESEENSK
ncbi:MAG TPA: histidine--tRNA ligase [Candidatus Krumholzibacteria bacterium]|nr:histidine--tRNA ligase [Candidatus Krumholzibacteria bacterium]